MGLMSTTDYNVTIVYWENIQQDNDPIYVEYTFCTWNIDQAIEMAHDAFSEEHPGKSVYDYSAGRA